MNQNFGPAGDALNPDRISEPGRNMAQRLIAPCGNTAYITLIITPGQFQRFAVKTGGFIVCEKSKKAFGLGLVLRDSVDDDLHGGGRLRVEECANSTSCKMQFFE